MLGRSASSIASPIPGHRLPLRTWPQSSSKHRSKFQRALSFTSFPLTLSRSIWLTTLMERRWTISLLGLVILLRTIINMLMLYHLIHWNTIGKRQVCLEALEWSKWIAHKWHSHLLSTRREHCITPYFHLDHNKHLRDMIFKLNRSRREKQSLIKYRHVECYLARE